MILTSSASGPIFMEGVPLLLPAPSSRRLSLPLLLAVGGSLVYCQRCCPTMGGPAHIDGRRCPPSWLGGGNGQVPLAVLPRSPVPPSADYYLLGGSPALRRRASGQPGGQLGRLLVAAGGLALPWHPLPEPDFHPLPFSMPRVALTGTDAAWRPGGGTERLPACATPLPVPNYDFGLF